MKTRFDIQLSEHFMLSEFIRSDTAKAYGILEQYVISNEIYHNLKDLVLYVLQPLRYAVGEIIINSGYRCEKLNQIVKGSLYSDHKRGKAADIKTDNTNLTIAFLKTRAFDQLIIYDNFLHVSYSAPRLRNQIIDKRK